MTGNFQADDGFTTTPKKTEDENDTRDAGEYQGFYRSMLNKKKRATDDIFK